MWSVILGVIVFVVYGILIAVGAINMDIDTTSS